MNTPVTENLFKKIKYTFKDPSLFQLSITHKSFSNENPGKAKGDNERLEFLGDAVLDFVISDLIMEKFTTLSEGDMSKIRASLVSESCLADIARELDLGASLFMGKGEEMSGGREKNSILSDSLEALFAAIFLDSKSSKGIGEIQRVIREIFLERIEEAENSLGTTDFKTELQELVQKRYKDIVSYRITRETGPDHDKTFETAVVFRNQEYARGMGHTKKQAEQEAARKMLNEFQ